MWFPYVDLCEAQTRHAPPIVSSLLFVCVVDPLPRSGFDTRHPPSHKMVVYVLTCNPFITILLLRLYQYISTLTLLCGQLQHNVNHRLRIRFEKVLLEALAPKSDAMAPKLPVYQPVNQLGFLVKQLYKDVCEPF